MMSSLDQNKFVFKILNLMTKLQAFEISEVSLAVGGSWILHEVLYFMILHFMCLLCALIKLFLLNICQYVNHMTSTSVTSLSTVT